jgi:uncharacterized OsmC-like protein
MDIREDLKAKLTSLGIEYKDNAPTSKLEELLAKIEEPVVEERINVRIEVPVDDKRTKRAKVIATARKRSLCIVYNNDKRNSEDTECFSSVRNSFFGDAKVIPIGVEWWISQMHIDNLKSIEYINFIKDQEGNAVAKSAKKYTVDVLDTDEEEYKRKLEKKNKS